MQPPIFTEPRTKPVRLAIADDHPFFIDGFYAALQGYAQVKMAGSALNGQQLLALVNESLPDVVFTDIQMPVMDGIEATRQIKEQHPYIHVVGFSAFAEDQCVSDMLEAGASGYLLKNDDISEVLKAIDTVMSGVMCYSPQVSYRLVAQMKRTDNIPMKPAAKPHFSAFEMTVMIETANELTSKDIAVKMGVDVRSVESAKGRLIKKIGCRNSVGIANYACKYYMASL